MGVYRKSRAIEASIIDYLTTELQSQWSDMRIEKSFAGIFKVSLPSICIRCGVTNHEKVEIGSDATTRTPQVLIDIFASDDGMRLDVKDFIIEKIKAGCIYYNYTIAGGVVQSKVADGRIRVLDIDDIPINFTEDRNTLDSHDRYRHLLTLSISLGKVEA